MFKRLGKRIGSARDTVSERVEYTRSGLDQARDNFSFHYKERVQENYRYDRNVFWWQVLQTLGGVMVFTGLASLLLFALNGFSGFGWLNIVLIAACLAGGPALLIFGSRGEEGKVRRKNIAPIRYDDAGRREANLARREERRGVTPGFGQRMKNMARSFRHDPEIAEYQRRYDDSMKVSGESVSVSDLLGRDE